jgi:hypothetical protein
VGSLRSLGTRVPGPKLTAPERKRAWKGFPWSVMDQLHEKGYISDPATKNKSVWLSEKGAKLTEELFEKLFAAK